MKFIFACVCVLATVICLQLFIPASGQDVICGLDGYDFNNLSKAEYWNISVPTAAQCILPTGVSLNDISSCNIYFSICRPLPVERCEPSNTSSVCQEVILTNGSVIYFNQGEYSTEHEYHSNDGHSDDGFYSAFTGVVDPEDSQCEKNNLSTLLIFNCNGRQFWDPADPLSLTVAGILRNPLDPCQYFLQVNYSGACYSAPTLAPSNCHLDDYNLEALAERDYWYAEVDKAACYGGDAISCVMTFAFCHPLSPNITETGPCAQSSTAVCQVGEVDSEQAISYNMGMFENYTLFYPNDEDGIGGFHVEYSNGSRTDDCPDGIVTRIIWACDSAAKWDDQDQTQHTHVAYDPSNEPCDYVISFQYAGACIPVPPTVSRDKTSYVGWILMGIFFGAVLSYLIVGAAIQYFVRGEKGVRVLPNYDFWRNFMLLTLEGCKFLLDVLTCFRLDKMPSTTKVEYDKL